ncbi:MAG TPA: tRNA (N(6)-L-threonylcarbamoyladenosine(37)-C(2))-methylthiotransferase MtaB [Desulfotomaculum sp.]|nr:tRNA (N(6)-L-threonylcarbamoyladenosine(37)-C(2))-methylthiotransferase MtaB [Desulfotomaculum sp.]
MLEKVKKVALTSLGCKVNQYDAAALTNLFEKRGYKVVSFSEEADIYVINTCTVTHLADRKSRQLIRRAKRMNPVSLVIVTGCYAQVSPEEVKNIPEVDVVAGTRSLNQVVDLVEKIYLGESIETRYNLVGRFNCVQPYEELPVLSMTERTRAYVKIQEGCNNFCTYCIIPYARGPLRSRQPEKVLDEAASLLQKGFKEIVLTGIHIGAYGQDMESQINLTNLLSFLTNIPALKRLRLSSIEPQDVNPALIKFIATQPKICRHFHIPLQSGDNEILRNMGRRYNVREYRDLANLIRERIKGVALTTDLIVGFPGETEQQFKNTCLFVREIAFSRLHVFKYSPRPGTLAATFPNQVKEPVKKERSELLISLGKELAHSFALQHVGHEVNVLVEEEAGFYPGYLKGLTDNYLTAIFPGSLELRGQIVKVKVKGVENNLLKGMII